jgi:glutathione S-transferase
MTTDRIELFTARVCPYAHRTRLVLIEKNVPFDNTEIDFKHKPPRFLEISPYGKVPAIVHDGATIYESAIINEYLDEVFSSPPLVPRSPLLRAKLRIWTDYCDDYFLTDHYALLKNREQARHSELLQKSEHNLRFIEREGFGKLSGRGPYWLGAEVSLLDFTWYPFFERLAAWTHYRGLVIPADCERLLGWLNAMSRRPSVRQIANDAAYYVENYAGYAGAIFRSAG